MTQTTLQYTPVHSLHSEVIKLFHELGYALHQNRLGPKIFSDLQRIALVMLFRRSRKALREFIEELSESRWPFWLDLRHIPGKSTLHDWCQQFTLAEIRALMDKHLHAQKPKLMAIDATGIDSYHCSRHYQQRIFKQYVPYAKLDVLVDTETLLVHDFVLRTKPRHEVHGAKTMFERTQIKNATVLGDGAYDSEPLHLIAQENQLTLFAPVRKSQRQCPRGLNRKRCAKGFEKYHQRSKIESFMHSLKTRYAPQLRSKLAHMKKREMGWILLAYNLDKMGKKISSLLRRLLSILIPDRADDGETAHVEFYHITGTDGKGNAPATPYPWDVRMQDIRKALVLEEGRWEVMYGNRGNLSAQGKKPFAVMRSDRNLSPLGDTTTLSSAAQTKTAHERGLIGGAIHYVARVTGDHLVATLALAAAVYVVNCGIQYSRTPRPQAPQGTDSVSQYTPAQQMLLMPAITIIPENSPGESTDVSAKKGLKIPLSEEEVLRKLKDR